jgi:hypothetical protein
MVTIIIIFYVFFEVWGSGSNVIGKQFLGEY